MKRLSLVASLWLTLVMVALVFGGGQVLGQTGPSITVANQEYDRNKEVTLTVTITDDDTDQLTTSISGALPDGLSATTSADGKNLTISGTVSLSATVQNYSLTITTNDGSNPDVTGTFTITINRGIVVTTTTLSNVFDAATGVLNSDVTSGDIITFSAGTYNDVEDITIDKPLTLTTGDGDYRTPEDGEEGRCSPAPSGSSSTAITSPYKASSLRTRM